MSVDMECKVRKVTWTLSLPLTREQPSRPGSHILLSPPFFSPAGSLPCREHSAGEKEDNADGVVEGKKKEREIGADEGSGRREEALSPFGRTPGTCPSGTWQQPPGEILMVNVPRIYSIRVVTSRPTLSSLSHLLSHDSLFPYGRDQCKRMGCPFCARVMLRRDTANELIRRAWYRLPGLLERDPFSVRRPLPLTARPLSRAADLDLRFLIIRISHSWLSEGPNFAEK